MEKPLQLRSHGPELSLSGGAWAPTASSAPAAGVGHLCLGLPCCDEVQQHVPPAIGTLAWQRTDLMGCSMLLSFDMMPDNKNSIAYLSLRCLGTVKASQRFAKPPLAITTLTAYVLYDTCWWSTGTAWWPLTTSQNSNQALFSISYLEAQVTCFLFLFFYLQGTCFFIFTPSVLETKSLGEIPSDFGCWLGDILGHNICTKGSHNSPHW